MFTAGIIMFILGCVMWIWLRLTSHNDTRALAPQPVGHRQVALRMMRNKKKITSYESSILMTVGFILILIYGVFN